MVSYKMLLCNVEHSYTTMTTQYLHSLNINNDKGFGKCLFFLTQNDDIR